MAESDWNGIERDYRAGSLSIREIARRNGIADSTLRSRANSGRWQRGDAEPADSAPDSTTILAKHRSDIARLQRLHNELIGKVRALVEGVGTLRELADAAAALERLGRITDRLITLERQVFHLDSIADGGRADFADTLKKAWDRVDGLAKQV